VKQQTLHTLNSHVVKQTRKLLKILQIPPHQTIRYCRRNFQITGSTRTSIFQLMTCTNALSMNGVRQCSYAAAVYRNSTN
jgi:hypothetical protein